MSQRVQWLREAWSFLSTYTGAVGSFVVDTTHNRLVVHDGATAGGIPQQSAIVRYKVGAPVAADLSSGEWAVFQDTGTGTVTLAINEGGTIKKVTLT